MTSRTCRTCKYAVAPTSVGCICTRGAVSTFHEGIEPCAHYRMAEMWKGIAKRRSGQ